ncbi:hypothetical protein NI17_009150 [Thermobifida halotolerans]|uniref:Uncharacterized protein n=1 Tax=Thermobifida halotolerans TaxID=483545 RepID=A0AA97M6J9_9ACTN|nr:hypothetical protein [Thermobifida halotolerans]UOE22247.1 hypothetical protein NI17_009150 [Thermobifida halotolerans]
MPDGVLIVDNKSTRIIPGLVMPYEAEDVYTRALPTYRHLSGHTYDILPAAVGGEHLLRHAANAHTRTFGRSRFLTKSPFNAFRIGQLEQLFGPVIRYVRIDRPRREVAEPLARNRFVFRRDGRELTHEQAYDAFNSAILADVPRGRTRSVTLEALRDSPDQIVADLLARLDESPQEAGT